MPSLIVGLTSGRVDFPELLMHVVCVRAWGLLLHPMGAGNIRAHTYQGGFPRNSPRGIPLCTIPENRDLESLTQPTFPFCSSRTPEQRSLVSVGGGSFTCALQPGPVAGVCSPVVLREERSQRSSSPFSS